MDSNGQKKDKKKTCFVIGPIGEAGSDIRNRSDKIFKYIIRPVVTDCGYHAIERSDMDSRPGMIGSQVINRLIDDDLVVADLTGHNPNVFYELAIRHMIQKPIVQIIQYGERIPFDVNQVRTIQLDHTDLDSVASCKEQLAQQIHAVEMDARLVDNPISQAVKLKALDQSVDPEAKRDATIIRMLSDLSIRVDQLSSVSTFEDLGINYGGDWDSRSLSTLQELSQFLNKSRAFRDLSPDDRKRVAASIGKRMRGRNSLSRREAASYLNYLIAHSEARDEVVIPSEVEAVDPEPDQGEP